MASTADLRRLVLNDPRLDTLILTFDQTLNIPQLQYALSLNATVKEIVIYADETFLPRFPVPELQSLLEVLGGIPSLQRLCFNSRSGFDGVMSVQALIFALRRAHRLSSFAVSDLKLTGSEHDWSMFAEQLQRTVYLRSFCIIECELVMPPRNTATTAAGSNNGSNSNNNSLIRREYPLDPMFMVLSILPCMEKVYFHSTRSGGLGKISSQAVGALLLSTSLHCLKIRDFDLGLETVQSMARMLEVNHVMNDLKVGTMSQFNQEAAAAFASMLKVNTTLECLEMGLSSMISDECATTLAGALKVNRGLKSFALTEETPGGGGGGDGSASQPVSRACKEAFVDMLRSNYVMENFVLFQRFPVKPEFKLFVTLNKLGRGRLLQSEEVNVEQWVQALEGVNDDLDALFYYVSINPDLCTLAWKKTMEQEQRQLEQQQQHQPTRVLRPRKRRRTNNDTMNSTSNTRAMSTRAHKATASRGAKSSKATSKTATPANTTTRVATTKRAKSTTKSTTARATNTRGPAMTTRAFMGRRASTTR